MSRGRALSVAEPRQGSGLKDSAQKNKAVKMGDRAQRRAGKVLIVGFRVWGNPESIPTPPYLGCFHCCITQCHAVPFSSFGECAYRSCRKAASCFLLAHVLAQHDTSASMLTNLSLIIGVLGLSTVVPLQSHWRCLCEQAARRGEGDRHIPDLKPKHLLTGKRGIGKTERR